MAREPKVWATTVYQDKDGILISQPYYELFETFFGKAISEVTDASVFYVDPSQRDRMDKIALKTGGCREDVYMTGKRAILVFDILVLIHNNKPVRLIKLIKELPLSELADIKFELEKRKASQPALGDCLPTLKEGNGGE